jgi:hypothetical protein
MPKGKTTGTPVVKKTQSAVTQPKKGKPDTTQQENAVANTAVATTTGNAINSTGSYSEPTVGGWKTGEKQGKWETGAEGQWKSGDAVGPWEGGKQGKWQKGAEGGWVTGDKTGPWSGASGKAAKDSMNEVSTTRGAGGYDRTDYGPGFSGVTESGGGAGGGGGTGSPYAPGLSEVVKSTGVKSTEQLKGISVEETVKGARRTKKTSQKRSL